MEWKTLIATSLCTVSLAVAGTLSAETLYFGYEGDILFFDNNDEIEIGCDPLQQNRFKGCYSIQSDAVDHNPDPEQGKYYPDVSWVEFGSCHFGSEYGSFTNHLIFATNYPNGPYIDDYHEVAVESFADPNGNLSMWSSAFGLMAHNPSDLVLSDNLPTSPPDPSLAFHREYNWHAEGASSPGQAHLTGWIDRYYRATSECEELTTPRFSCVGFEPPMADYPVRFKKNHSLPLRAEVFDSDGFAMTDADLTALPVVQVWFDSGSGGDAVDVSADVLAAGQGDEGNQFIFTEAGVWEFILGTKDYSAEGTYTVMMATGDDSEYVFDPTCITEFVVK